MNTEIRVRFAPSPTGPLHIGGVRTALYNFLFARKNKGRFILRIEDTDRNRFVPGTEEYISESLAWLGIEPDESPWKGGSGAPYRQSERKGLYLEYARQLMDSGHAYYAFDSAGELEEMREDLQKKGVVQAQYNYLTRGSMKNSLTLEAGEVQKKIEAGEPYVIRLKVPSDEGIRFRDIVRDWVQVSSGTIDDKVLLKSDGMPTYHLANVVDDHLMRITHVIRGEEWLPSAPLHVLLYKLFGWEESMPEFAHLPLILKPEGEGKLSKRDGDKHGFPVFPISWKDPVSGVVIDGFRENGYFPAAILNFLALLGWNPGTDRELFDMASLIDEFTLKRINKAGARFDIDKAKWINHHYLVDIPSKVLGDFLEKDLLKAGIQIKREKIDNIADAFRDRVDLPTEIFDKARYFFNRPGYYDEKVIRKKWNPEMAGILQTYAERIESLDGPLNAGIAREKLAELIEEKGMGMGQIMQVLRVAVTGEASGVDLMVTLEILGRQEVAARIIQAVQAIEKTD